MNKLLTKEQNEYFFNIFTNTPIPYVEQNGKTYLDSKKVCEIINQCTEKVLDFVMHLSDCGDGRIELTYAQNDNTVKMFLTGIQDEDSYCCDPTAVWLSKNELKRLVEHLNKVIEGME